MFPLMMYGVSLALVARLQGPEPGFIIPNQNDAVASRRSQSRAIQRRLDQLLAFCWLNLLAPARAFR